jgi:uncharacterized protein (DUF1330 family)
MQANELHDAALDAAAQAIGHGPVVMVNLVKFREAPDYPEDFAEAKPDSRSGYYEGYVSGFHAACEATGVTPQLLYAGERIHNLLAGPDDHWDDIVVVRYDSFADLRAILDSDVYASRAKPHRFAAIADWRFIATRAR